MSILRVRYETCVLLCELNKKKENNGAKPRYSIKPLVNVTYRHHGVVIIQSVTSMVICRNTKILSSYDYRKCYTKSSVAVDRY